MESVKVKVSSKGQISIPAKFRKKMKSDYLEIIQEGDHLIVREASPVSELAGSLKSYAKKKSNIKESEAWGEHVKDTYNAD